MANKETILVIGASGQIGTDLTLELRKQYGSENVIAADVKTPVYEVFEGGPYEILDALDKRKLKELIKKHDISQVYLLAALLSATAEQNPEFAWKLNIDSLLNVLYLAKEGYIKKIFWPSSIAVFGPTSPKTNCPQHTITEPTTVYGFSKLAGERWCEYYFLYHQIDVRSLRYPGLISYKSQPGGGTTDYAVHIYYEALRNKAYECYLKEDTKLPMMYMDDAIRATLELMQAEAKNVKIRSSYNLAGISFTPNEIYKSIQLHIPDFSISYKPDHRQKIADSWPGVIDDANARSDWGWKHEYNLDKMTSIMLNKLKMKVG